MKFIWLFIMIGYAQLTHGQADFPEFLVGTWKVKDQDTYEHWDQLNDHALKGFSYARKEDRIKVNEYLNMEFSNGLWYYEATVMDQNQGKSIPFKQTYINDSTFIFENPNHDFPNQITYHKRSDNEIRVKVSGKNSKGFEFTMNRQVEKSIKNDTTSTTNPAYDSTLASRLGADDYGMKSYMFILLKTGPNTTTDKELIAESFRGHMENINRLVTQKKLIIAGPLGTNENQYRGIFILNNVHSVEEAEKVLQTDPAISNGLLQADIVPWYGSAALPEYLPVSDKIWKKKP